MAGFWSGCQVPLAMMLALDMLIFHKLITNLTNVVNDIDIRAICPFGSFVIFIEHPPG